MSVSTAAELSKLVNSYSLQTGPPKTIVIPKASQLATLGEVTITGTLLKKQLVTLNLATGKRTAAVAANNGVYKPTPGDGDLHFCLGTTQKQPHIACELQSAKPFISLFNQAVGSKISVTGFFRCLFEHPGFRSNDDAHCFEIHPVRAVTIDGQVHAFDVGVPDQDAIHTWLKPNPLNNQDNKIGVSFDKPKDTLTFTKMDGSDENYVSVSGTISKIKIASSVGQLSSFVLTSSDIGHPIDGFCMTGTNADKQLKALKQAGTTQVDAVVLRNIDLPAALTGKYKINVLAIAFKSPSAPTHALLSTPQDWLL